MPGTGGAGGDDDAEGGRAADQDERGSLLRRGLTPYIGRDVSP
jgi:hypothetical protein